MDTTSPAATVYDHMTKTQFLELVPGARFGSGALPGRAVENVVLMPSTINMLDVRALRQMAAQLGYVMHLSQSALAAPGARHSDAWFTPEAPPVSRRAEPISRPARSVDVEVHLTAA